MRDGPEMALYPAVVKKYPRARFHHLFEVPYGRKRIDLVAVPRLGDQHWVVAIEFKVRDWRSGLWQARLNTSIVHRSFLAMDVRHMPASDQLALFTRVGVGLIAIEPEGNTVEVVVSAQTNSLRLKDCQIWELWTRRSKLGVASG